MVFDLLMNLLLTMTETNGIISYLFLCIWGGTILQHTVTVTHIQKIIKTNKCSNKKKTFSESMTVFQESIMCNDYMENGFIFSFPLSYPKGYYLRYSFLYSYTPIFVQLRVVDMCYDCFWIILVITTHIHHTQVYIFNKNVYMDERKKNL